MGFRRCFFLAILFVVNLRAVESAGRRSGSMKTDEQVVRCFAPLALSHSQSSLVSGSSDVKGHQVVAINAGLRLTLASALHRKLSPSWRSAG